MRVIVFDYGAGNLHSLGRALASAGARVTLEQDPSRLLDGDLLVLPGVGAFGQAASRLAPERERVRGALLDGHACLGLCLGMQLLFESSEEGEGEGLGLVPGRIRRLVARRVPHMGWNRVRWSRAVGAAPDAFYFANGLAARPDTPGTIATTRHDEAMFAAAVATARTLGLQFHPEKSGPEGVRWLGARVRALAGGEVAWT